MKKRDKIIPPIRVSEEEKTDIQKLADASGLTVSEFVRRAALGVEINTRFDLVITTDLFKVNADIARIGNLLKLALDRFFECDDKILTKQISDLIHELSNAQMKLKEKIFKL